MKLFDRRKIADFLLWAVPLALVIPNVILCVTGDFTAAEVCASLLLPYGVYVLLSGLCDNTPLTTLLLLPMMVLAAFQIVVVRIYNCAAPIGVDMFLNVVTTNSTEINELFSGLIYTLSGVVGVYLSIIVAAIVGLRRHIRASAAAVVRARMIGVSVSVIGTIFTGLCCYGSGRYRLSEDMFPVNAFANLVEAVHRQTLTTQYRKSGTDFTYEAQSVRPDERELYIVIIGETSRADNWELLGYGRHTNPGLTQLSEPVIGFNNVFSESNTTHKAVPMLLTTLSADTFNDSIYTHKSIITAFKEAGFHTVFISNQERNHSFIEEYEKEAHEAVFIPHNKKVPNDIVMVPIVKSLVASGQHLKQLIVVHMYGSHYKYHDRYDRDCAVFTPDNIEQASSKNRKYLLNAYDNSIVNTDKVITECIGCIETLNYPCGLAYCSDHGEDIYDDERNRFMHASPEPSYWQLHVPMLMWFNDEYRSVHRDIVGNAESNRNELISSSRSFAPSVLQMAGIESPWLEHSLSVSDSQFRPSYRGLFLNDNNEAEEILQ